MVSTRSRRIGILKQHSIRTKPDHVSIALRNSRDKLLDLAASGGTVSEWISTCDDSSAATLPS